jgi:hypothetical protein
MEPSKFCSINKSTHKWDLCAVGIALRDKVCDDKSIQKYHAHKAICKEEYLLRVSSPELE